MKNVIYCAQTLCMLMVHTEESFSRVLSLSSEKKLYEYQIVVSAGLCRYEDALLYENEDKL